jgi:hypothetical protein
MEGGLKEPHSTEGRSDERRSLMDVRSSRASSFDLAGTRMAHHDIIDDDCVEAPAHGAIFGCV